MRLIRTPEIPTTSPTNLREWLTIWRARLRLAIRWFWPLDLAILALNLPARFLTAWAIAHHAMSATTDLNPLARTLFQLIGLAPTLIAPPVAALALLLVLQTLLVSQSRLGKRIALFTTCALLAIVTLDSAWDLWNVAPILASR